MAQMIKNLPAKAGAKGLIPGLVKKIPWRRKWQPTLVFLPGEFHEERNLVDYRDNIKSFTYLIFRLPIVL